MSEPTISPDGKYMWTGSEWIPLPPNSDSEQQTPNLQAVNLQDSVIGGDIADQDRNQLVINSIDICYFICIDTQLKIIQK